MILGIEGVYRPNLSFRENIAQLIQGNRQSCQNFIYSTGAQYTDYKSSDKVAVTGLAP